MTMKGETTFGDLASIAAAMISTEVAQNSRHASPPPRQPLEASERERERLTGGAGRPDHPHPKPNSNPSSSWNRGLAQALDVAEAALTEALRERDEAAKVADDALTYSR